MWVPVVSILLEEEMAIRAKIFPAIAEVAGPTLNQVWGSKSVKEAILKRANLQFAITRKTRAAVLGVRRRGRESAERNLDFCIQLDFQ